ncbi:MAG: hypothetical protein GQ477_03440 [Nanohaloarchaea archaeon]|nr:hypothetical protein [Candidatus Nanohaloarchaea archaeon]
MIDKRYLIFFIGIIGLSVFFQGQPSITGNILLSEVNVSINSFDNGQISYFNYPDRITQYSKVNIGAEFLNTGSTSYTKEILLQIGVYGDNMTVVANRTGLTVVMKPGDRSFDKLSYTPLYYGFYWMHLIVSYGNKTDEAWGTFYVDPYYIIVIPPNVTEDDGPGGPLDSEAISGGSGDELGSEGGMSDSLDLASLLDSGIYDTGRTLVTISNPDKIYVRPGESTAVYVIVNNTGTMTLRRMMLLPRSMSGIKVDAQPRNIQILKGTQSAIFMITVDVPADILNRTYPLDFKVLFDKGNRTGHVDVVVGPRLDEDLMDTILNYRYIITRLKSESDTLYFDGKNTSLLENYISLADSDLVIAKDDYDVEDYDSVREYLKRTKLHLDDAVLELASLRSETMIIVFAPNIWLLIVLAITMITAIGVVYAHRHNLKKVVKEAEDGI